jgi:hypothetical protein
LPSTANLFLSFGSQLIRAKEKSTPSRRCYQTAAAVSLRLDYGLRGPPLPHFSVSSATNFPKSGGVSGNAEEPRLAIRALIAGSASAVLVSLLSLAITSAGGVPQAWPEWARPGACRARNRRNVADEIEIQVDVGRWIDRLWWRVREKRVAVRFRSYDRRQCPILKFGL